MKSKEPTSSPSPTEVLLNEHQRASTISQVLKFCHRPTSLLQQSDESGVGGSINYVFCLQQSRFFSTYSLSVLAPDADLQATAQPLPPWIFCSSWTDAARTSEAGERDRVLVEPLEPVMSFIVLCRYLS